MTFEEVMDGLLFNESTSESDKKKDIVEKIESEVERNGYTINISNKSKEVFYGNKDRDFVTGINNLCIAGIGKENYEEVYKIISNLLKDDKDFTITKDNYFTLFLDVKPSSDMYVKENALLESCKNVDEARKFLREVDEISKKYNANYYIVTDGTSKINNNGNPAVKYAREQMKKWEKSHGYDPDEDWGNINESEEESEVKETPRNLKDIIEKKYPGKHKKIEIVDNHIACCSEETEKHYKFKRLYYIDDDGKIVGSLTMHAEENLIANLFIEKKYRRKGYASKLIECAVNKYGMKHLRVFKNNTNAIALYKKLGYTEEPKDPKLTYNDKMYYKEIKGPIKIEKESVNESEDLDYLSYFTEGNNDLIYHNFEDFESGKCNFCFVTGLSGSGKSTLAKQLAEKYDAEYIELDLFHFALHKKDPRTMPSPIFYEYLKRHKDVWDIFKDKEKRQALTGTELGNYLADFIEYTVDYAKKHPNKKFIIEGVQIFSLRNPARFENYPLIIINRSIARSFVQRLGREINKPEDIVKQIKRTPKYINFYKDDRKNLDDFIQYFNESEDLDYLSYFTEANETTSSESCKNINESVEESESIITKSYGIIDGNGIYNAYVKVKGNDKPLRGRSEILIVKNDFILLKFNSDGSYDLPGGSWEKDEDPMKTACREAMEEVRINTKNVIYVGDYVEMIPPKKWMMEKIRKEDWWYGKYTKVYIGEYHSRYNGKIDDLDRDNKIKTSKFYKIDDVYDKLKPIHKIAIDKYLEKSIDESEDLDYLSYFIEATDSTYYIKDEIYPIVEKVLSTQMGDRAFRRLVEKFIDKNGPKLLTIGPVHMVPFADKDKAEFYKLFNTNETELKESIKKMTTHVNDKANWKLITQNPIFCLFYCCIRYYTVKKDTKGKDIALIIYALAAYPSIFYNYFQYGANPGVMQYTIDNMTQKFIIKNEGHIFGTLRKSISNSWEFHKDYFEDMCDKEVIRFIQRIRNDQNSLLKKIANEYYKNYEKGLTVKKTVDKFDDNAVVDDILNNTSVVEDISRKIVNGMMTGGVNLRLAEIAAKICQISVVDSRFYITKIMVEKNTEKLQKFIESILFIYLYDENHTTQDINSGYFISKFAPELFKKTNSNNPNIKFIKKTLDEWAEESGVHDQFKREASRVNYKKAIYFYIILSIQSYSN